MSHRARSRLIAMGRGGGLRAQLLRGGMGVGTLKMLSLPLTLAVSILLARGLGPEGFGQYAFVIALITTLSIPLAPALMQLTTRETAAMHQAGDDGGIRELLQWANRHVLMISALFIIAAGGVALRIAEWRADDRWTLLLAASLALPLLGLNAVRSGILAGLRRVVWGQFPELFVRSLGILLVAGILSITGALTPLSAVAAFVAGGALAFVVGTLLLHRTFPHGTAPAPRGIGTPARQWRRAWIPFTLLVAASTLNAQIGILLLGWLSTPEQVAAMQIADRGAMLVALSLNVVNLVIGPHITRVHHAGNRATLQAISCHSTRLALIIALPIALLLVFFGGPILTVAFGADYAHVATLPLAILALGQLVNIGFGSVGMFLTMSGFERDTLIGQVSALFINVVAAVILIPPLGGVGAALATAIGLVTWNCVLAVFVASRLRIRPGPI